MSQRKLATKLLRTRAQYATALAHLGEPRLAVQADGHAEHLAVLPEHIDQVVVGRLLVDP